jgi:hypothetical protein
MEGQYLIRRTIVTSVTRYRNVDWTAETRLWMKIQIFRNATLGGQVDIYWSFEGHRKQS